MQLPATFLEGSFLDNGAYSELSGGFDLVPREFADFVSKHHGLFDIIVAPDRIGSAEVTLRRFRSFRERLDELGLWEALAPKICVAVHASGWHRGDYLPLVREAVAESGCGWVAIGGIAAAFKKSKDRMIIAAIQEIRRRLEQAVGPLPRVHLLGVSNPALALQMGAQSIDSTTWLTPVSYGMRMYTLRGLSIGTVPISSIERNRPELLRKKLEEILPEEVRQLAEIDGPPKHLMTLACLAVWVEYSRRWANEGISVRMASSPVQIYKSVKAIGAEFLIPQLRHRMLYPYPAFTEISHEA